MCSSSSAFFVRKTHTHHQVNRFVAVEIIKGFNSNALIIEPIIIENIMRWMSKQTQTDAFLSLLRPLTHPSSVWVILFLFCSVNRHVDGRLLREILMAINTPTWSAAKTSREWQKVHHQELKTQTKCPSLNLSIEKWKEFFSCSNRSFQATAERQAEKEEYDRKK